MRKHIQIALSIITVSFLLLGCNRENEFADLISLDQYIEENNLTVAATTPSGVRAVIFEPGTSAKPNANSTVRVKYRGYLTNGSVFDQSSEDGITFGLRQVIPGWTEGIPLFGEGGEGILLIPANAGYGPFSPSPAIPPNADLIFDIELLDF